MRLSTRKLLDTSFSATGMLSIIAMSVALVIILGPILWRGFRAVVFKGTVEHRRILMEQFEHGDAGEVEQEIARKNEALAPVFKAMDAYEKELEEMGGRQKREAGYDYDDFKAAMTRLVGPLPGEPVNVLIRNQYGATRMVKLEERLHDVLYKQRWEYPVDEEGNALPGYKVFDSREKVFEGTALASAFPYLEEHINDILQPKLTFYWQFFVDESVDAHFFGGIWPEILGTFYLTVGAMLVAVPIGILTAIYLVEYAGQGTFISLLRSCISTLAGVPSIVFGLFGLAVFINSPTFSVSSNKSVLAGALTLAVLILPTVIRASEEAIKSVPRSYIEAALGLGSGKWRTVMTVILPAALPGILTGIVISMGRAAGETAPIIFTAAVSVGRPLGVVDTFTDPSPALSWNIYNLCTEHEAVKEIRHVQYGMVMTLVMLVLFLNMGAIMFRARISKRLKG